MPIIVKDFAWHQTETSVIIQVPLRGVHQSKVDLLTTQNFIKASYDKFHFEVFLLHNILVEESKCTLTETHIIFQLIKGDILQWESLERNLLRAEKNELRKKVIDEEFERQKQADEKYRIRKHELKRVAIGEAIKQDAKQREKIDTIKHTEKTEALGDFKQWQSELVETSTKLTITELDSSEDDEPITIAPKKLLQHRRLTVTTNKAKETPIPTVRSNQTLKVEFSERILPTPSRESKLAEENEYLQKQAMARRSAGFVSEDLRPEEKNPQYLLAKGDEFLKNKNYLGAISAYSFGIKISEQFVDLYIQRSQAHIAIENYRRAIEDCSSAMELMKPEVEANRYQRAICIGTRALALNKIGMKRQAVEEMSYAIKLDPNNELFRLRMKCLEVEEMEASDTE